MSTLIGQDQVDTLDVTGLNLFGEELSKHVSDTVNDSQLWLLTPIPSHLLVTAEQFASMGNLDLFYNMMDYSEFMDVVSPNTDVKMFYTEDLPDGKGGYVLEVKVKEEHGYKAKTEEA